MRRFWCQRCLRWFPDDVIEFGHHHRIIVMMGPDIFHSVIPEEELKQRKPEKR